MAQNTKIEWADHTFNPWIGCTKISPACENCYAEQLMDKRAGVNGVRWGAGQPRRKTKTWGDPVKWNAIAATTGARPFVFCASLADVLDNEVPHEWRLELYELWRKTPYLVWLILTKRIGNAFSMLPSELPRNVAIGATMATQAEYDRDNPKLWRVKQGWDPLFTFGSFEPQLERITIDEYAPDWIITGGESGPNARPYDEEWAHHHRKQAVKHRRVFNFKQHGGTGPNKGGHLLQGKAYLDRPYVAPLPAAA